MVMKFSDFQIWMVRGNWCNFFGNNRMAWIWLQLIHKHLVSWMFLHNLIPLIRLVFSTLPIFSSVIIENLLEHTADKSEKVKVSIYSSLRKIALCYPSEVISAAIRYRRRNPKVNYPFDVHFFNKSCLYMWMKLRSWTITKYEASSSWSRMCAKKDYRKWRRLYSSK